ncbi:MAG: ATP-binding protein [Kofleriaceae bacterium]
MRTRTPRLRLAAYLGAMVILFVVGGLFASFLLLRSMPTAEFRTMSRLMAERLVQHADDPAQLRADLADLTPTRLQVTVFGRDRAVLASSVVPPLSADLIDHPDRFGDLTAVHAVTDGDRFAYVVSVVPPPTMRQLAVGMAILLAALLLLVALIVRHVGTPLQRIAGAARRFGRGDLTARAGLTRKDELGEVGRAFDEMAARVTLLMNTQRELMANVSHELQTPLARVQVAVDLMLDGVDDQAKELLPEISRDLGEVERLIEDTMSLARFDLANAEGLAAGAPLRREPTDVAALVARAAARFRTLHPDRRLEVDADRRLPSLTLDPVLVLRVLDNLLENARKYSEPDTAITLSATAGAATLELAVTDRGIGIDAADLDKVWMPFFRTDRSRNRATGGAGLGLALARRIVVAHGGAIAITSTPDQGTRVTLTLPLATSPPGA